VVAACLVPGISIAAVALANELNANLVRRWVKEHRDQAVGGEIERSVTASKAKPLAVVPVTVESPAASEAGEIRIDIRRGQTTVQMAWPAGRVESLGQWLKELLE
jgi:transposase